MIDEAEKIIELKSMEHAMSLFGSFDENIKVIEDALNVKVVTRNDMIRISGEKESVDKTQKIIDKLFGMIKQGGTITKQTVRYLTEMRDVEMDEFDHNAEVSFGVTFKGKHLKTKTIGQGNYINAIKKNPIVFGIGPAGTGKTFLAVAMAVSFLKSSQVNRIILTRPAVEAGEKLGFLPGDLQEKVDPYLRPIYDALFELIGADNFQRYTERGIIEVAPLAYMRGRTLDDSFIILDEAQNTTPEQMKMFLTRIGQGSRAVINGDITQIDLPGEKTSGLRDAEKLLSGIDGIGFVYLSEKDVVRHELVQKIIKAYESKSDGE